MGKISPEPRWSLLRSIIRSHLLDFHAIRRRRRAICLLKPCHCSCVSHCYFLSAPIPRQQNDWHVSRLCVLSPQVLHDVDVGMGEEPRGKPPAVPWFSGPGGGGPPAVSLASRCDPNSSRTTPTTLRPCWLLSQTVRTVVDLVFFSSNWISPIFFKLALEKPQCSRRVSGWANSEIFLDSQERRDNGIQEIHKHTRLESWTARPGCF